MRFLKLEQGSDEWLAARQHHITATDAATILGVNPWCSPYLLWSRKLGLEAPQAVTAAMQRGSRLEDEARCKFEEYTGLKMRPAVIEADRDPWMMASLDGLDESNEFQLEIKCPNAETHDMAKSGKIPPYYHAQVQHQLACTGLDWSYYFSYDGKDGVIVEVEKDTAYIEEMMEKERDFYRKLKEFEAPPQKHQLVESEAMKVAVSKYSAAQEFKKKAAEFEKEAREMLMAISSGKSIQGFGLKLTHYIERGRIDYNAIPELDGVDLDLYRKSPVQKTRISFA